jgi:hypothetical protein
MVFLWIFLWLMLVVASLKGAEYLFRKSGNLLSMAMEASTALARWPGDRDDRLMTGRRPLFSKKKRSLAAPFPDRLINKTVFSDLHTS